MTSLSADPGDSVPPRRTLLCLAFPVGSKVRSYLLIWQVIYQITSQLLPSILQDKFLTVEGLS